MIVKDFEKGIRPDHEPTVAHYEALLAEKGVKGVTKVMSLRELKVEYKTFESKTALSHLYDHFLVDARIIRLVPKFLGKPFYKRKKFPVQVKLDAKDLVKEMEKALSTSCLALAHTGTSSCVTIGLTSMPEEQLSSNLVAAVRLLETRYPGGWANIRALHLLSGTDSLPFYATLRATKEVNIDQLIWEVGNSKLVFSGWVGAGFEEEEQRAGFWRVEYSSGCHSDSDPNRRGQGQESEGPALARGW